MDEYYRRSVHRVRVDPRTPAELETTFRRILESAVQTGVRHLACRDGLGTFGGALWHGAGLVHGIGRTREGLAWAGFLASLPAAD